MELLLPENDFKTCPTVNFPKKPIQITGACKSTQAMKFRLEFILCNILHMNSIYSQTCLYDHPYRITNRLRQPMLSPTEPIPIQLIVTA